MGEMLTNYEINHFKSSKIPPRFGMSIPCATFEGDNTVLLQQTSKYLMRAIGKKFKTRVLDLTFVHEKSEVNLDSIEDNLRNLSSIEAIVKDILRKRYHSAVQKMAELKTKFSDSEEIDLHFHP